MRERDFFEGQLPSQTAVDKRFQRLGARAHYLYHTPEGGGVVEKKANIPSDGRVIEFLRHRTGFGTGSTFTDERGNLCEHVHGDASVPVRIAKTTGEVIPYPIHVPGKRVE